MNIIIRHNHALKWFTQKGLKDNLLPNEFAQFSTKAACHNNIKFNLKRTNSASYRKKNSIKLCFRFHQVMF